MRRSGARRRARARSASGQQRRPRPRCRPASARRGACGARHRDRRRRARARSIAHVDVLVVVSRARRRRRARAASARRPAPRGPVRCARRARARARRRRPRAGSPGATSSTRRHSTRALALDALRERAEHVGQVAPHLALVDEARQPARARAARRAAAPRAATRPSSRRRRARSRRTRAPARSRRRRTMPLSAARNLTRSARSRPRSRRVSFVNLQKFTFQACDGLPEHEDVGAGAEDALLAAGDDDAAHLGVLEAQPLDRVGELDVDAEVVGVELQLVARRAAPPSSATSIASVATGRRRPASSAGSGTAPSGSPLGVGSDFFPPETIRLTIRSTLNEGSTMIHAEVWVFSDSAWFNRRSSARWGADGAASGFGRGPPRATQGTHRRATCRRCRTQGSPRASDPRAAGSALQVAHGLSCQPSARRSPCATTRLMCSSGPRAARPCSSGQQQVERHGLRYEAATGGEDGSRVGDDGLFDRAQVVAPVRRRAVQ